MDDHTAHLNVVFDNDDTESTHDLESILDHCYISGVLELCCKYSTGDTIHNEEWYSLSMVQDEDPYMLLNTSLLPFLVKSRMAAHAAGPKPSFGVLKRHFGGSNRLIGMASVQAHSFQPLFNLNFTLDIPSRLFLSAAMCDEQRKRRRNDLQRRRPSSNMVSRYLIIGLILFKLTRQQAIQNCRKPLKKKFLL